MVIPCEHCYFLSFHNNLLPLPGGHVFTPDEIVTKIYLTEKPFHAKTKNDCAHCVMHIIVCKFFLFNLIDLYRPTCIGLEEHPGGGIAVSGSFLVFKFVCTKCHSMVNGMAFRAGMDVLKLFNARL